MNSQTFIILCISLALLTWICLIICDKRRQSAIGDIKYYMSRFSDPLGCAEACGYFYDGWSKVNFFGITGNDIKSFDLDNFHKGATDSLKAHIAQLEVGREMLKREYVDIANGPSSDIERMETLEEAACLCEKRIKRAKEGLPFLLETHRPKTTLIGMLRGDYPDAVKLPS